MKGVQFVKNKWVEEWFLRGELTDAIGFKSELIACKRANDYLADHNNFDCDKIDRYYEEFIISLEKYKNTAGNNAISPEGVSVFLDPFLEKCWKCIL